MIRPTAGGQVVLDLTLAGGEEVVYGAALLLPDAEHLGRARVRLADGQVSFDDWEPPDPPAWLVELAQAFLRGEWRARRGEDPEPWPRRINRWRKG